MVNPCVHEPVTVYADGDGVGSAPFLKICGLVRGGHDGRRRRTATHTSATTAVAGVTVGEGSWWRRTTGATASTTATGRDDDHRAEDAGRRRYRWRSPLPCRFRRPDKCLGRPRRPLLAEIEHLGAVAELTDVLDERAGRGTTES
jgi:hypothetical protein